MCIRTVYTIRKDADNSKDVLNYDSCDKTKVNCPNHSEDGMESDHTEL